jgi:pimeloyl-ACP methyl ester carboxylesterase
VLLHGFGANGFTWRNWLPTLNRDHRVLNVDLKGFGRSHAPRDGRYRPYDHVEEVVGLLRELNIRRPVLMGHSMGGGIAILTALRLQEDPELEPARGLVMVSGAAYRQKIPKFIGMARTGGVARAAMSVLPRKEFVNMVLREVQAPGAQRSPEQIAGYAEPFGRPEVRYATVETALNLIPEDLEAFTGRYPTLETPTQLLWGEVDRVVPLWVGRRLAEELPNATLTVLFGCGHIPQDELPEESLEVVMEFLDDLA